MLWSLPWGWWADPWASAIPLGPAACGPTDITHLGQSVAEMSQAKTCGTSHPLSILLTMKPIHHIHSCPTCPRLHPRGVGLNLIPQSAASPGLRKLTPRRAHFCAPHSLGALRPFPKGCLKPPKVTPSLQPASSLSPLRLGRIRLSQVPWAVRPNHKRTPFQTRSPSWKSSCQETAATAPSGVERGPWEDGVEDPRCRQRPSSGSRRVGRGTAAAPGERRRARVWGETSAERNLLGAEGSQNWARFTDCGVSGPVWETPAGTGFLVPGFSLGGPVMRPGSSSSSRRSVGGKGGSLVPTPCGGWSTGLGGHLGEGASSLHQPGFAGPRPRSMELDRISRSGAAAGTGIMAGIE